MKVTLRVTLSFTSGFVSGFVSSMFRVAMQRLNCASSRFILTRLKMSTPIPTQFDQRKIDALTAYRAVGLTHRWLVHCTNIDMCRGNTNMRTLVNGLRIVSTRVYLNPPQSNIVFVAQCGSLSGISRKSMRERKRISKRSNP